MVGTGYQRPAVSTTAVGHAARHRSRAPRDYDALIAVRSMADYRPANAAYALPALNDAAAALDAARTAEINAQNALNAARDTAIAAEWHFHNQMLGTKEQVIAQYGADSNEVAALGLKKKSDRKRPQRREPQPEIG